MKYILLILSSLLLAAPAWGNLDPALDEIEMMIRIRDYRQAASLLVPMVQKGDREAQYRLAGLYRSGKGVARNLEKATELYHQAASANHADAQYSLALLIEKSNDSPSSRSEAHRWYKKSAAQGHRQAKLKLDQFQDLPEVVEQGVDGEDIFNAIRHNDEILVYTLIASGANLDLRDRQGNTTVMAALRAGWPQLAAILIDNTLQFDQPNLLGNRPLLVAAARGYRDIVKVLLDKNVDIDQTDARGDSALMMAVKNKKLEIAELLLKRGANHGLRNKKEKSAVDLAYAEGNPAGRALFAGYGLKPVVVAKKPVVSDLDEFKTSVRQHGERYTGWPLLNIAIELGERSITKQLVAQKPDLGEKGPEGNTALHVAARKGDAETLRQLLALRAKIDATNSRNETALYLAVESTNLNSVSLLLKKRADPSIETSLGRTALELAIEKKQLKAARLLLRSKTSYAGLHRVLLQAIQIGMEGLSFDLIKRDKQLGSLDDKGRTALWHSASKGLVRTSEILIASGKVDINQTDVNGYSALAEAVKNGHDEVVRLMLKWKADPSGQTNEGNTLLMLAVISGKHEIVQQLLKRRIDVNAQDNIGETALMLAAGTAQNQVIEMLITAGADMQLRNKEDLNAYQIAVNSGHQNSAQIIHDKSNFVFKLFN